MYTVDIDIGGTLTDGLVGDGDRVLAVKRDTTPHDLTVCFFDCLQEAASQLGFPDLPRFLEQVAVIRWSSTIATNVLAERKGPRVGLLGSAGVDEGLYGSDASPAVGVVLDRKDIVEVAYPLRREEVLARVRQLLEQGVRRMCVSLKGAYRDSTAERQIKAWVAEQYPDHYLGAVPMLAGTDMILHPDDQTRTHMALINAFVHPPLAGSLFKAEDELLHTHAYRRSLYIGHVNGGVARVAKTRGFDTLESGPVFGVGASAYFARRYGHDQVVCLDLGGTTAKIGVIVNGQPVMSSRADMFGILLETPWLLLRSSALGGGSVVRVEKGQVRLGPESMGAYPGPACYGLGGDQTTLTDALLTIGLLNPDRFLNGTRRLNVKAAHAAIQRHVATPLKVAVEEAAGRVVDGALDILEHAVGAILKDAGSPPQRFHLYAFGGNGGLLGPALSRRLRLQGTTVFHLGHVFSALGSAISEVCQISEAWPDLSLESADAVLTLARCIESARDQVRRDLDAESAGLEGIRIAVEITATTDGRLSTLALAGDAEARNLAEEVVQRLKSGRIERITVRGIVPVPCHEPRETAVETVPARAGRHRLVVWPEAGAISTDVHDREALGPGAYLEGPAVVEAGANTWAVPPGWRLEVDGFGNGRLTLA